MSYTLTNLDDKLVLTAFSLSAPGVHHSAPHPAAGRLPHPGQAPGHLCFARKSVWCAPIDSCPLPCRLLALLHVLWSPQPLRRPVLRKMRCQRKSEGASCPACQLQWAGTVTQRPRSHSVSLRDSRERPGEGDSAENAWEHIIQACTLLAPLWRLNDGLCIWQSPASTREQIYSMM